MHLQNHCIAHYTNFVREVLAATSVNVTGVLTFLIIRRPDWFSFSVTVVPHGYHAKIHAQVRWNFIFSEPTLLFRTEFFPLVYSSIVCGQSEYTDSP